MKDQQRSVAVSGHVYVVDDEKGLRSVIRGMLAGQAIDILEFESAEKFLVGYSERPAGCILLDIKLPGMNGLELLERISDLVPRNAVLMISGYADIPSAVRAVKMGAVDFIQKPFRKDELIALVTNALESIEARNSQTQHFAKLTPRERDVLLALRQGDQNKVVAARLGLSPRTVEMYRARLFQKLGVANLAQALTQARDAGLFS
jgi:two-component system response regulator FixJ